MLKYQSMVFSIALRILGERPSAEEAAQDVFLELHRKLADLVSDDHIRNWLRRVAVHRSLDLLRQHIRRPEIAMDESDLPDVPDASPAREPESDLSRWLQHLVGSLPEIPRAVLILRYQEEMSVEEIAGAMEMPAATVKSHLQRSLRLLREKAARAAMRK